MDAEAAILILLFQRFLQIKYKRTEILFFWLSMGWVMIRLYLYHSKQHYLYISTPLILKIMGFPPQPIFHRFFRTSLIIKGLNGMFECAGGIFLFFVSSASIARVVQALFQHELVQDPADFIATHLVLASQHLSSNVQFLAALYLLVHGFMNIGLAGALWFEMLWAYPFAALILVLLTSYQVFKLIKKPSLFLVLLTLVDIIIIFLLRSEYKRLKKFKK